MCEPRVLIYAAGTSGLGSIRRGLRLAEYVCAAYGSAEVVLVTGVPTEQPLFAVARAKVVLSPAVLELVRAARRNQSGPMVQQHAAAATSELMSVATEFNPDVFVTTSHAGLAGELRPALEHFGRQGRRRVLALRDIYWPPRFVEEFEQLSTRDFESVLVGGPRDTSRWIPRSLLEGPLARRVRFVGYLGPSQAAKPPGTATCHLIRCQVGGGRDGYDFAELLVDLARTFSKQQHPWRLQVSTGPLMPERHRSRLQAAATDAGNVEVQPWIIDPFDPSGTFGTPEMLVSMAGYNACVEAAWHGAATILLPRRLDEDAEQQIRARRFAHHFTNIRMVNGRDPATVMNAISRRPLWRTGELNDSQLALFADHSAVATLLIGRES